MAHPLPASLLALAPTHLPNRRQVRYLGDDDCVELHQLAERDQALIRGLYHNLTQLLFALSNPATDDAGKWQDASRWVQAHPLDTLVQEVRELGSASGAGGMTEALAKALHDVRGGALSALLGRLESQTRKPRNQGELNTLFILARDHLKIMRSAVVGLDEPRRHADREPKAHAVQLMIAKWHESVVSPKLEGRAIRLFMDCRFEGALTECCLESAAIDRIFYNLANNACRHAATDRLDMAVFPIPDETGSALRFVLSNEVNDKDAAYLRSITQGSQAHGADKDRDTPLMPLFTPKVSTTGSGFGLTVVADFVAGAFGLSSRIQALRERYVGAVLEDNTFRIWFHWPVGNPALPPKADDYHDPAHSLSEP